MKAINKITCYNKETDTLYEIEIFENREDNVAMRIIKTTHYSEESNN